MSFTKPYEYQDGDSLYDHSDDILNDLETNQSELHDRTVALKSRSLVQDGVTPTIHFDFANQRYSKWTPNGMLNSNDLTDVAYFTRSTIAGTTSADGRIIDVPTNEPRYDYRGGECRGLLVENASTSVIDNPMSTSITAGGDAGGVEEIVADQILRLHRTSASGECYVNRTLTDVSDGQYLFYCRVSNVTNDRIWLRPIHYGNMYTGTDITSTSVYFRPSDGTITSASTNGIIDSYGMFQEGDTGIWCCWCIVNFLSVTSAYNRVHQTAGDGTDDVGEGLYIHGMGVIKESKQPRNLSSNMSGAVGADQCYVIFDGEFNTREGTLVMDFHAPDVISPNNFIFSLQSDATTEVVSAYIDSNNKMVLRYTEATSTEATMSPVDVGAGSVCRLSIAWDENYLYGSINGADVINMPISKITMSGIDRLFVGGQYVGTEGVSGKLNAPTVSHTYYPKCLSQNTLKTLSTVL